MSSNEKFEHEFEAFLTEEDSRLAALYRKLPPVEPDARLDAAVRSMAHRALNPQLVATPQASARRRRAGRWVPALGAAAGVVLAAGIAYRLGPSLNDTNYRDAAPASGVITVHPLDAPAIAPPPPLSPAPPPASSSAPDAALARSAPGKPRSNAPAPAPPAPAPVVAATEVRVEEQAQRPAPAPEQRTAAAATGGDAQGVAKAKPAPRPFPPELDHGRPQTTRQMPQIDSVERKQITATAGSQNLHDLDSRDAAANEARERSLDDKADAGTVAPATAGMAKPAAAPAAPPPAAMAAAPAPGELAAAKDAQPARGDRNAPPLREVSPPREESRPAAEAEMAAPPPAGAALRNESSKLSGPDALKKERAKSADPNARLYPEHWLANIRTMLAQHRRDDALRSLAEFRRLYPDYPLPDDLRDLK